jgi:hypothetical protein
MQRQEDRSKRATRADLWLGALLVAAGLVSANPWASSALAQSEAPASPTAPHAAPPATAEQQACLKRLANLAAHFEALPAIGGACPAVNVVRLTEIEPGLTLRPAAIVSCALAETLSLWVKTRLVPTSLEAFGEAPVALSIGASYVCRNENGLASGKLSEHAKANAVDLGAIVFKTHVVRVASWPQGSRENALLAGIRASACLAFTTVLGPGADPQHADNLHLDLRQRHNGYSICQ